MKNIDKIIQSIADIYLNIWDFSNFCADVHNPVDCQKPGCRFKICCDILSNYLKRVDRTNDEKGFSSILIINFLSQHFPVHVSFIS